MAGRRGAWRLALLAVTAGLLSAAVPAASAAGGTRASIQITITVAQPAASTPAVPATPVSTVTTVAATADAALVRSVTVSATTVTYGSCSGADPKVLSFPNGRCVSAQVEVKNGAAAAKIDVSGASAGPADDGKSWTLCGGQRGAACAGARGAPGENQYSERTAGQLSHTALIEGPLLSSSAACDTAFSRTGCTAAAKQTGVPESLELVGPASSSDRSTRFTTTIVWTAT